MLAGLTTAAVTFLLGERSMRAVFALALAGEVPSGRDSSRTLGTGLRLLVCWALGSGIALLAIALAFLGRGDSSDDELIGPVLFSSSQAPSAVASCSPRQPVRSPSPWPG